MWILFSGSKRRKHNRNTAGVADVCGPGISRLFFYPSKRFREPATMGTAASDIFKLLDNTAME